MCSLTYLGRDILKLPFIKTTSLGHEVLHNWWGVMGCLSIRVRVTGRKSSRLLWLTMLLKRMRDPKRQRLCAIAGYAIDKHSLRVKNKRCPASGHGIMLLQQMSATVKRPCCFLLCAIESAGRTLRRLYVNFGFTISSKRPALKIYAKRLKRARAKI
jgi:hypothetical protein